MIPRRIMTYGIDTRRCRRARGEPDASAASRCISTWSCRAWPSALPVQLNLPGRHNVLNALAAAAIGWQLGVDGEAIARALAAFPGRRAALPRARRARAGPAAASLLVDDYGHHPRELAAVFAAVRGGWPERRLVVGFQPHRYSRTRDLLDDFANVLAEADVLVLTEVYPAGEAPIAGADGRALARAVRARGKVDPVLVEHPREFKRQLAGAAARRRRAAAAGCRRHRRRGAGAGAAGHLRTRK